jgi:hypothetical protein
MNPVFPHVDDYDYREKAIPTNFLQGIEQEDKMETALTNVLYQSAVYGIVPALKRKRREIGLDYILNVRSTHRKSLTKTDISVRTLLSTFGNAAMPHDRGKT